MDVLYPFSVLQVAINEDTNEEDDCIIIENDEVNEKVAREKNMFKGVNQEEVTGIDDPLYAIPPEMNNGTNEFNAANLLVTTNINSLSDVSPSEAAFRKNKYPNIYEVLNEILHCSICQGHIGCDIRIHPSSYEHPVLKVMACERCTINYSTVNFVLSVKGKELNCRWCGKVKSEAALRTCQQCPFSFCELCLLNNCPNYDSPRFPWTCLVCHMRVLWPARATLWALYCLTSSLMSDPDNRLAKINGDISICCKSKKKRKQQEKEKQAETLLDPPQFDLDRLVLPHMLDGSTENSMMSQALPLNRSKVVECYSNANKFKIVKSKSKPKPKLKSQPKFKPKPKAQVKKRKQLTLTQQQSSKKPTQCPIACALPDAFLKKSDKKPHWLRTKLIGYIADFYQLKTKLEDIEDSLEDEENNEETDDKINAITTLLSLHGDLLKSCQLNLINEWKERKARTVLENYNPNILKRDKTVEMGPINLKFSELTSQKYNISNASKKEESTSSKISNNYNKGHQIQLVDKSNYIIKDCFVKLNRIRIPSNVEKE